MKKKGYILFLLWLLFQSNILFGKVAAIHAPCIVTGNFEVVAQQITGFSTVGVNQTTIAAKMLATGGIKNIGVWLKFALGASDVSTIAAEEYVKGNPDTEFSKTWIENRNIICGSLLVANLTDVAITAYANKAKNLESQYLKETGQEFAEIENAATRKNLPNVERISNNITEFTVKTLPEKLEAIANIWKTKFPAWEMMEGRTFFEQIMREYRYTKAAGWAHTADIAHNFKGVDFYKGFTTVGDVIYAETAVSMKTTIATDVDKWLKTKAVQDNIDNLKRGFASDGITWNGKTIQYNNAKLDIYMPKENLTPQLKAEWLNKLSANYPEISFDIQILEDFIK